MALLSTLLLVFATTILSYETASLPEPRIVLTGPTGAGKSSLADVLLGQSPLCTNCTFPICDDLNSCTKATTFAVGPWLGTGDNFTIVDTPGFGDSDNDDSQLIDEMMTVLKDEIESANVILLLLKGTETRLDSKLQQMIREMEALFGSKMWDNIVVGVSFWEYSQEAINKRNKTCHWTPDKCQDETWFKEAMTSVMQDKFHFEVELPFIFIDSWAKHPMNVDDTTQQRYFDQETSKLWEIAINMEPFAFLTIEDILEENQQMKERIQYLEDVIEKDIANLNDTVDKLMHDMGAVQDDMVDVRDDIIDNGIEIHNISGIVALYQVENGKAIADNGKAISDNGKAIADNGNTIAKHGQSIAENGQDIDNIFSWFYDVTPSKLQCSGYTRLFSDVTITSPNYSYDHTDGYPNNVDCSFTLIPRPGQAVYLEFTYFVIYPDDPCADYVEIDPPINGKSQYCGEGLSDAPPTTTFDIDQQVTVRFVTDGEYQWWGWSAIFNIV